MEVSDAIKNRRSIRRYKADPVDDAKIEAILEAGRWAPSWSNTQCWRFIVVRDPAIKSRLAATLNDISLPGREIPNPASTAFEMAPVVIAVCAEMGKSGCRHGSPGEYVTDKGDWYMFDTALAVQNMVLTAHALGLGTVIIGAFDSARAEKALGVPEGYRLVVLFPVGVPEQPGRTPPRKELPEIAFRDGWGK
jgi:nitroreductase